MPILTLTQLQRLRQILRDASTAVAVSTTGMVVPQEEMQRLVSEGWLKPGDLPNAILNSYEFGRLMVRSEQARNLTYDQLSAELREHPVEMTEQEQVAYDIAADRAGELCRGLGIRASAGVDSAVMRADEDLAGRTRQAIREGTSEAIAKRQTVGELRSRLGQVTGDWLRDWKRIARTEMQLAHQQGLLEHVERRRGDALMAKMPSPRACDACLDLYLEDGKPMIRPASWWRAQGVTNVGRRRAEWRPVLGAMHPWCVCQLVEVPDGWTFNDAWELEPPEAEKSLRDLEDTIEKAVKINLGGVLSEGGWQPIPKGKHGGFRRRSRGGWEYWYPKGHPTPGYHPAPPEHQGTTLEDAVKRREQHGVPIVVSWGVGVDSTAMLVGMQQRGIRPDKILFADVGGENPATYAFLGIANEWLKKVGFPEVTVVRLKPGQSRETGESYATLEEQCRKLGTLPSLAFGGRGCSQKWKHGPQEQHDNNWQPAQDAWAKGFKVTKLIGYSADPADKRRPNVPDDEKYHYLYPLREWGWDRERSEKEIKDAGLPVPTKSSCWFCPAIKPAELRSIVSENPDIARRIIRMEAAAEPKLQEIRGLWIQNVLGTRGGRKKPGLMSEWIVGEELLPEFRGQRLVYPWWRTDEELRNLSEGPLPKKPSTNEGFTAAQAVRLLSDSGEVPVSQMERLSGLVPAVITRLAHKKPEQAQLNLIKAMSEEDEIERALAVIQAYDQIDFSHPLEKAEQLHFAHPMYVGPRGGKWADPEHTHHWEPPQYAETERGRAALRKPVPALSTVFVNASGGAEKKRFREGAEHLARHNIGIQIVAHEIPMRPAALAKYGAAGRKGLRVMVDSGEFGRFSAELSAAIAEKKAPGSEAAVKARRKSDEINGRWSFDRIFDQYEALARAMPPGTLQVVAPDKIADPAATAELRARYAPRVRRLQELGAEIIVPMQARTPTEMAADYVRITEAFGENVILAFPTAKAPIEMEAILPFVVTLYAAGRYPKLHFLGATEPAKLAGRTVQLVAAAYFSGRGIPRDRVLSLVATPRDAARALRNVKTREDVLTRESDLLAPQIETWAREQVREEPGLAGGPMDPDGTEWDETETWPAFMDSHPEEFDLDLEDKEAAFGMMAGHLSQSDSQAVGRVQQYELEHDPVTGRQRRQSADVAAQPKVERFVPLLNRYLQAKEHVTETMAPTFRSGYDALFGTYAKSQEAAPGEIHNWRTGPHQKQADGDWKPVQQRTSQLSLFDALERVTEVDQQPVTRLHPEVRIPPEIKSALERGGYIVINSSGGKDSQALTYALATHPELQKYRDHMIVLHADLGRGEWAGSMQHAEKIAKAMGLRFEVARRDVREDPVTGKREPWEGDMLTHFEERAAWPNACGRFCTSDLKTGPLWKWMRHNLAHLGVPVISALGIRKQEGEGDKESGKSRWFAEELGRSTEFGKVKGEHREAYEWNPLLDWKVEDVWAAIKESGVDRHYAYDLGMSRLSCLFCVLASRADLMASARANPQALEQWIQTENAMRRTHEARRQVFANAIARAQIEGRLKDDDGDLLIEGAGKDAELLQAGGRRKGADLKVPKRYLRPFLEFQQGFTLENLRQEALAKAITSGALERIVAEHQALMRSYAKAAQNVERLRARAVAEEDPDQRSAIWRSRRQAMGELAAIGKRLAGSHPFPGRRGKSERVMVKSEQPGQPHPPGAGWEAAPRSRHGGLRRRHGDDWEYWYPTTVKNPAAAERVDRAKARLHERIADLERVVKIGGEYRVGADRWVAVLRDPTEPKKVRVQRFDLDGFSGHQTYDTLDDLIEDMARDYDRAEPSPGTLDKLAVTDRWAEGSAAAQVVQIINTLGFHGHYAQQRQVSEYLHAHGPRKTAEVLGGALKQISEGKVPPEIEHLEKSKPANVGEVHVWADGPHQKQADGDWKPVKPKRVRADRPELHERFGPAGAPQEGERGYRPPPERHPDAWDGQEPTHLALKMIRTARKVWEDEDYGMIAKLGDAPDEDGEPAEWMGFTYDDLPDLLHVPYHHGDGSRYTHSERLLIAERLMDIAGETKAHAALGNVGIDLPAHVQRKGEIPDWSAERFRDESGTVPTWVAAAILADSMDREHRDLRVVLVSKDEARKFIEKHHKALPYLNPRGLMYAIGVRRGGRLVAVATAGHPTGRALRGLDPKNVLELTRVASDGTTRNAASMLTARLLDLLERSKRGDPDKPALFVTYQLATEEGNTYRALKDKGLRPTAFIRGTAPHGARAGAGEDSLAAVDKIRWEAGPAAAPAQWSLLEHGEQLELLKSDSDHKLAFRTHYGGLPVSIENRAGSRRRWYDKAAEREGETLMSWHYGRIPRTEGTDGDAVDVFLKPDASPTENVYVITTMRPPAFREVDEQKVMLGASSASEAKRAYLAHYDDPRFFGRMTVLRFDKFRDSLKQARGGLIKSKRWGPVAPMMPPRRLAVTPPAPPPVEPVYGFRGSQGLVAGPRPPVNTMGNYGKPARTPGEAATEPADHPMSYRNRKKKKRKRRFTAEAKQAMARLHLDGYGEHLEGSAKEKPDVVVHVDQDAERQRAHMDQTVEDRLRLRESMRLRLVLPPQDSGR